MHKYFTSRSQGILLNVKLTPKSKKIGILGCIEGGIKIGVNSPPVDNKANEELIKFLSKEFKVPKKAISIESGETSRSKVIFIGGVLGLPNRWEIS